MKLSKICLGTAQLGMQYGINNLEGRPSLEESRSIVATAIENGINVFDTAPEYGDSEKILGEVIDKDKEVMFISKVPPADWNKSSEEILEKVKDDLQKTLLNLKIDKIPIYLFHRFRDMKEKDGFLLDELIKLKRQGKIGKIGVSIYSPDEAEEALALNSKGIEVIQIPFNLIDKRLLDNGFLAKSQSKGVLVLARSVFLQGLFFKQEIPDYLDEFKEYKEKLDDVSRRFGIPVGELALRYVLSIDKINSILIGVEKKEQLIKNLEILNKGLLSREIIDEIDDMGSAPDNIVNPSLWKD